MTTPSVSVLIPAAGAGQRLGLGPKAFVEAAGKPLLAWAVEAFAFADEILVALPPGHRPPKGLKAHVLEGGEHRQDSVARLLEVAQGDIVLVHDAARPYVVARVVQSVFEAAKHTGAAVPVIPVPDTLIRDQNGTYGEQLPRERYRLVQTPQGFFRNLLLEAHQKARRDGFLGTDEATLVRRLGYPVTLVPGDRRMLKVTYPEDLALVEALLKRSS